MDLTDGQTGIYPDPPARQNLRHRINEDVGDMPSLVGTLSDVSGLVLAGLAARVVALEDHASSAAEVAELAQIKAVMAGAGDIVQASRDFLDALSGGSVKITAQIKGVDEVMTEAPERSTRTAEILQAMQG